MLLSLSVSAEYLVSDGFIDLDYNKWDMTAFGNTVAMSIEPIVDGGLVRCRFDYSIVADLDKYHGIGISTQIPEMIKASFYKTVGGYINCFYKTLPQTEWFSMRAYIEKNEYGVIISDSVVNNFKFEVEEINGMWTFTNVLRQYRNGELILQNEKTLERQGLPVLPTDMTFETVLKKFDETQYETKTYFRDKDGIMIDSIMDYCGFLNGPERVSFMYFDSLTEDQVSPISWYADIDSVGCSPDLDDYYTIETEPKYITRGESEDVSIKLMNYFYPEQLFDGEVTVEFWETYENRLASYDWNSSSTVFTVNDVEGLENINYYRIKCWANDNLLTEENAEEYIPVCNYNIVKYDKEVAVLTDTMFVPFIYKAVYDEDYTFYHLGYEPLQGIEVTLNDGEGGNIAFSGTTDVSGKVYFPLNLTNNRDLYLNVNDNAGFELTDTLEAYMWSQSNKALSSTSANHIIRNSIDKNLYMTYYMYDMTEPPIGLRQHKIILGTSNDEGKTWELEKVANGFNPSIVQLADGDVGLLYDEGISYLFENVVLPNPSTVTNGSLKVEPGSIALNPQTGLLHSTGIKTLYTEDNLNLIHAVFDANNPEDAQVEIVINRDGLPDQSNAIRVPFLTPSISMWYNALNSTYYPMMAFVDTDYDVILRYFDVENQDPINWDYKIENISNSPASLSLNPYVECKGENTFLIWQEQVNTDEYAIYMNGNRSFIDSTFTDKRFPKIKNGTYISCLERTDLNRIKVFPYQANYYGNPITVMETSDSVYAPDMSYKTVYDGKNQKTTHTIYSLWEQKTDGVYKIKTDTIMFVTDKTAIPTSFAGFTDTFETTESPIYDYVNAKGRRVETFVKEINGLDEGRYYEIELNTTNSSKTEPYVVMLNGIVKEVIYGKENKTLIQLEADDYADGAVEIRFDRLKGNPNRMVEMGVYEFDEVGDAVESASKASVVLLTEKPKSIEQMKLISSINGEVKLILGSESIDIKNVRIIDVLGREIASYASSELKGKKEIQIGNRLNNGIYFVRVEMQNGITTKKVNIIK